MREMHVLAVGRNMSSCGRSITLAAVCHLPAAGSDGEPVQKNTRSWKKELMIRS